MDKQKVIMYVGSFNFGSHGEFPCDSSPCDTILKNPFIRLSYTQY